MRLKIQLQLLKYFILIGGLKLSKNFLKYISVVNILVEITGSVHLSM